MFRVVWAKQKQTRQLTLQPLGKPCQFLLLALEEERVKETNACFSLWFVPSPLKASLKI